MLLQEPLSLQYGSGNDQYATEPLQYTDVSPQQGDLALVEPSGYALKHKYEMEYGYRDEDGASNSDMVIIDPTVRNSKNPKNLDTRKICCNHPEIE